MDHSTCSGSCEHKTLAYCKGCKTAYCKDCKREWRDNPYAYWYTTPATYGYPYTSGNTFTITTAEPTCTGSHEEN